MREQFDKKFLTIDTFHVETPVEDGLQNPIMPNCRNSDELDTSSNEVEKTDEQIEQINHIIDLINNERLARGQKKRLIDHNFIHFYDKKNLPIKKPAETEPGSGAEGVYYPIEQSICMIAPKSRIQMLDIVTHELIHADSYNALWVDEDGDFYIYRNGFTLIGEGVYFLAINEAIIQERTRQLMANELANNPFYADEVAKTSVVVPEGRSIMIGDSYIEERQTLKKLVSLIAKSSSGFDDDVYDMFVSGSITGNYMPIARLMENNFGKGAFRRLGENSSTLETFINFVEEIEKNLKKAEINKKIVSIVQRQDIV